MNPKQFKDLLEEKLDPVLKTQKEQSEKIDAIIVELHQVHNLADATLDVVKARYEKNKKEINEIKDRLGLQKEPYYGE